MTNPILLKSPKGAIRLSQSYDPETETLSLDTASSYPEINSVETAKKVLEELTCDTLFKSPADKARYYVALLTPALQKGGWLDDARISVNIILADNTQAGKGHLATILANVYGESPHIVTDSDSQAGNIDNMLPVALASDDDFIVIDNIVRDLQLAPLEALLTATGKISSRAAYTKSVTVKATDKNITITGNDYAFKPSLDLLNRALILHIQKRRTAEEYQLFDGEKIDVYIRKNSNHKKYLWAINILIQAWVNQGCPEDKITTHDAKKWAGVTSAIVHGIMGEVAPFADYEVVRNELCKNRERFVDVLINELYQNQKTNDLSADDIAQFINANEYKFAQFFDDKLPTNPQIIGIKLNQIFGDATRIKSYEFFFDKSISHNAHGNKTKRYYITQIV